jgi:TolB-like protein
MPQPAVLRFGAFRFHRETLELTRQGAAVRLQTQPARLLRLLVSKAGELVTREAIRESLWHDGTTVDFEVGVNRSIRQLRAALGDDIAAPRYIKTIPRLGYCFIAAVVPEAAAATTDHSGAAVAAAPDPEPQPSIAILPFADLSGDPQNEYFGEGLAEEITNALAQTAGLKVIARTSAFAFKGKPDDIRKIAAQLGAGNVLEGSVRRNGARIRITVQLIHGGDGMHLLSKRYDRDVTDIFALQDEIAADVAQQLRVRLGVAKRPTESLAAYEKFLEGRFQWHKFTPPAFQRGLQCFEEAVAVDPAYGAAYTGIAQCRADLVTEAGLPAQESLPQAAAAARRALDLDPGDAEAHATLGQIAAILDYDWRAAESHFRRALELNPTPYVRASYALWYLIPHGQTEEAVAQTGRLIEDEPLHLAGRIARAAALLFARQYDAAAESCLRVLEIDGAYAKSIQMLSLIRGYQQRFAESIEWAERLIHNLGRSPAGLFTLAMAHALSGNADLALRVLSELESFRGIGRRGPSRIGLVYAALQQPDLAFAWLEKAVQEHEPPLLWIRTAPRADSLRDDPRFRNLLGKMNLLQDENS